MIERGRRSAEIDLLPLRRATNTAHCPTLDSFTVLSIFTVHPEHNINPLAMGLSPAIDGGVPETWFRKGRYSVCLGYRQISLCDIEIEGLARSLILAI